MILYLLLVWEQEFSLPGRVINFEFSSDQQPDQPPETCHGHFLLRTRKPDISPSECQVFVCFQLKPHWTEGPGEWMQNDSALETSIVNSATLSFQHCSLN